MLKHILLISKSSLLNADKHMIVLRANIEDSVKSNDDDKHFGVHWSFIELELVLAEY